MSRKNIDPIFKQILQDTLTQEGVHVETEVEVARLPRTIDGIVTVTDPAALPKLARETPFNWFKQFNIIAFKGANDPLTERDYHLIWGRSFLAIGEKDSAAREATLTIICGRTPRNEMARLRTDATLIERGAGVYQVGLHQPRCYLIVINELPPNDERYAILYMFTSSKKLFQQYLRSVFTNEAFELANLAGLIRPDWTQEFIMVYPELVPRENYNKWIEFVLNDLFRNVPPEVIEEHMTPEQRTALSRERLVNLTDEAIVERLSPDEIAELRRLLNKLDEENSAE